MPQHSTIDELLTDDADRAAFEAEARSPKATVDSLLQWLLERGFTASRSAVGRWVQKFRVSLMEQRMGRSGELARAVMDAAKEGGALKVYDAAIMAFGQSIFEALEKEDQPTEDLERIGKMIKHGVQAKGVLDNIARRFDEVMEKTVSEKKTITQEDIAEVRKAVFGV